MEKINWKTVSVVFALVVFFLSFYLVSEYRDYKHNQECADTADLELQMLNYQLNQIGNKLTQQQFADFIDAKTDIIIRYSSCKR